MCDWGLRNRELDQVAEDFEVLLYFLPPFWSSCNPQEYIWAEVKKNYRADDSDDHWTIKLKRAWDLITPRFREQAISRSIKFCRDHLKKIEESEVVPAVVNHAHGDEFHSDSLFYHHFFLIFYHPVNLPRQICPGKFTGTNLSR